MSARIRFRLRITKKKHVFFFCPARPLDCYRFPEKQHTISGDKRNIPKKKKFISKDKKYFSGYVFFCLFFVVLINFFLNRSKVFFHFFALINFSRNMTNVSKICSMFFFSQMFFFLPSLDFGFFLI